MPSMGMTPNERSPNREFALNQPQYQGASILLARDNFGRGSSREHAVWALQEYGFRAVIAPSFWTSSLATALRMVFCYRIEPEIVDELFAQVAQGLQLQLHIDLEQQTVAIVGAERAFDFSVDPALKQKMLSGMDDIDMTLAERGMIEVFEQQHRSRQPWLFRD